jgi:ketosteroid isomerase-like protein
MSTEVTTSIEAANLEFYRAVEGASIERMEQIWLHESWVKCVHPGWDMIAGWQNVRDSWVRIFESGQKMRISATDVVITAFDGLAWVTCTENITVFAENSFDSVQAIATNLFARQDDRWLIVHHHASPVPTIIPDHSSDIIQ